MNWQELLQGIMKDMQVLGELQPNVMQSFNKLHYTAMQTGALDAKTKELIALAISISARCDGCIAAHVASALRQGATEAEIADTLGVSILMGGAPAVVYALHAVEAMNQMASKSSESQKSA